jgi:hypothetical protein
MSISPLFQPMLGFDPPAIANSYRVDNVITLHHGESQTFLTTIPDKTVLLLSLLHPIILENRMSVGKILLLT